MITKTVIHQIQKISRQYPDKIALVTAGGKYNYRELTAMASGIKQELIREGFEAEPLIGVLTGDDVYTYASILAILANGSAYVPINNKNPSERNAIIIKEAGINGVLASRYHAPLTESMLDNGKSITIIRSDEIRGTDSELDVPSVPDKNLAYLFFTSGSTGTPKGVPIYHYNLNGFLNTMLDRDFCNFSPEDRFLQMFELTFDLSVMSLFTPLCIGAGCYVVPEKGVAYLNIVKTLQQHRITVALLVPSVLSYLRRFFDEIKLSSLRYSIFCGEALSHDLVECWSRCCPNAVIQNAYGPTEATIYCLIYTWSPDQSNAEAVNGIVAIGTPMPGMHAYIIDENHELVKDSEKGELCLYGVQVTDQYWNNKEKTAEAFIDITGVNLDGKVYRTGDICFINQNQNFIYCGRLDSQVKVDGFRVELGEIEYYTREFTGNSLTAAIAAYGSNGDVSIRLFIEDSSSSWDELKAYLRTVLPPYMIPKQIRSVEKMPLNINGKIDRKALEKL